jgi:uncharacterized membrane protein YeiB
MHVLAEGKMRCLFSMVFGASMILLPSRAEVRASGTASADIYYRRSIWLMLFGIVHAYLFWAGDILYWFSLFGLVLYPFRRVRPRNLLIIGAYIGPHPKHCPLENVYASSTPVNEPKDAQTGTIGITPAQTRIANEHIDPKGP